MAVSLWLPVPNDPTADIYGTPGQELLSRELGMNRTWSNAAVEITWSPSRRLRTLAQTAAYDAQRGGHRS